MDLYDAVQAIRAGKRLLLGGVLAGILVAAVLSWSAVRSYSSSMQLFVSAGESTDTATAYQGDLFSQQRVISYVHLLHSEELAQQVVDDLRLPLTASRVADKVSANALPNTVVLEIRVTDTSPERAQAIATSLGRQFTQRVTDLETPEGATTSTVTVSTIEPPDFNPDPVSPDVSRNLTLGVALGLLLGLGLALMRSRLDRSVRTDSDVLELTRAGLIGRVFDDPQQVGNPVSIAPDGQSPESESYRVIRTNLDHVDRAARPRVVVVTSALPDEGKTTIAVNLSVSLTSTGSRVVLVDGNLRRPRVTESLGLKGKPGLTDVLTGTAELADVTQPWGDGRLSVLAAGPMPINPDEVLGPPHVRDLLQSLRDGYDFVIIDTPPLLSVIDAAVLSVVADGCLMVARYGETKREQLAEAATTLERVDAKLLGVVLNRVPRSAAVAPPDRYSYKADPDRGSDVGLGGLSRHRASRRDHEKLDKPS